MISKIAGQIQSLTPPADISEVLDKVEQLLDDSIGSFTIAEPIEDFEAKLYDVSRIDFEKLRERFEKGKKRIQIEELKALIERKLNEMIAVNRARIDFLEKYKEMITEYNEFSKTAEETFQRLIDFIKDLNEEEQRHFREGLRKMNWRYLIF